MSASTLRAIRRESNRLRAQGADLRQRIAWIGRQASDMRRSIARALREPPVCPGESRVSGLDSGLVAAWLAMLMVAAGAVMVAAIAAHVVAAVLGG